MEKITLMEVCGTHTMAIARYGIKNSLPEGVRLLSGPGCPVCVTAPEVMDQVLGLTELENVILTSYGDMIRVPGSRRGDSLRRRKAMGAAVEIVYSPMDALEIADRNPEKEVIFLGVGFETTAPGTAISILQAQERKIHNFSVFSMLKQVEPALRALIADEAFAVDGFLCPGHVATVIGAEGFRFLAEEFKIPAVVTGFEAPEIRQGIDELIRQVREKDPALVNAYPRAVKMCGNRMAMDMMWKVFEKRDDIWRGLGEIPESGLQVGRKYEQYDAEKKFHITYSPAEESSPCRCGDVICGKLEPVKCPLFGKACDPENPMGPCMVSGEGACAAAYKYSDI